MNLKNAILTQMDRDVLRVVVDHLELRGVDRRSRDQMAVAVARTRRATAEVLLEFLHEDAVQSVCESVGVDSTGRRKKTGPTTASPGESRAWKVCG